MNSEKVAQQGKAAAAGGWEQAVLSVCVCCEFKAALETKYTEAKKKKNTAWQSPKPLGEPGFVALSIPGKK